MAPAAISKPELFNRLAAGSSDGTAAAGITVVTPNRRLAQALRAEFDLFQIERKKTVWEDADILPLDAFAARRYEEALYAEGGGELPMLLSDAQARELWEAAIADSRWGGGLLDVPRTAKSAADAWKLASEWRIQGALDKYQDTEDVRAFAEWGRAYSKRCRQDGLIDAASLLDLPLGTGSTQLLVAYAFDMASTQEVGFFSRFAFAQCKPVAQQSAAMRASFASPGEELDAAARWARARVEGGAKRVGVVVLDLELRRREVVRVFTRTMGSAAPFNISLGERLSDYPLASFALHLLELSFSDKPYEEISRLLRSPFLGGAQTGMAARALLDARLRREVPARLSLPKLIGRVEGDLQERLKGIFEARPRGQSPQDWAEHFANILRAASLPQERGLDSAEYQTQARFNEVLGEFARLTLVNSKMHGKGAWSKLRRLCAETLFQPESPDAPVQVLGRLESAGLEFDALWVCGLTDDAWPLRARPNPFLPLGLQRMAGIPESSAEGSLEVDRRITAGWRGAAGEVVFSWPRRIEDRDSAPSPLILPVEERAPQVPAYASWRDLIFAARTVEGIEDAKAPPVAATAFGGGTRVLTDQSACPFRAFARWRLGAQALQSPEEGPDAMDRGNLLHALMAGIWREAKVPSALTPALIDKSAKTAVAELGLEGRFAQLEVQRLVKLANDWLAVERERAPFEVVHVEQKRRLRVAGLEFSGRIDRMDRLTEGEMRGTHVLIDYKTGSRVTSKDWEGPRPDDPQLPIYAVTAEEAVSALAFAKLRAGDMKFSGFSRAKDQLPDVKQAKSWDGLVEEWKKDLETLAGGFASGEAAVDPKRGLKTCERCDLHPLCRVHEKLDAVEDEEGEGDDG